MKLEGQLSLTKSMQLSSRSEFIYSVHVQSVPGGHIIGHSKQSLYIHVCYSERFPRYSYFTVQLYKTVDKKETLRTVSDTGIYC
jgi:hypothetical protein